MTTSCPTAGTAPVDQFEATDQRILPVFVGSVVSVALVATVRSTESEATPPVLITRMVSVLALEISDARIVAEIWVESINVVLRLE
jgi:hypothetical protein